MRCDVTSTDGSGTAVVKWYTSCNLNASTACKGDHLSRHLRGRLHHYHRFVVVSALATHARPFRRKGVVDAPTTHSACRRVCEPAADVGLLPPSLLSRPSFFCFFFSCSLVLPRPSARADGWPGGGPAASRHAGRVHPPDGSHGWQYLSSRPRENHPCFQAVARCIGRLDV